MRKLLAILTAIVIVLAASAYADDGLTVSGEKGLITIPTADTVPGGKFSAGFSYSDIDRDPLDVDITYYSVTFGYGVTDNLEIVGRVTPFMGIDIDPKLQLGTVNGKQVPPPLDSQHGTEWRDGFGDLQFGAKYTFVRSGSSGFGARVFLVAPTASADSGLGTGKMDIGFDVYGSGVLGGGLELAGNAGFTFRGDPDLRDIDGNKIPGTVDVGNPFRWGVGAKFPAESRLQGIVELTGEVLGNDKEFDNSTDLTAGLRIEMKHDWYLTFAARRNLQAETDQSQYPNGGVIMLAYSPGRVEEGEAVPPPPTAPPPAPPPPPPPAPAPAPPAPPEFVWPEVYFPFDQYVLTGETKTKIDQVVDYMTSHPDQKVTIEGHCCYIGTDEYNLALGQHRADAIRDYMVGRGISADRLKTVSYGEARPKYDNDKEITRRFNRRGFFVVITPQ